MRTNHSTSEAASSSIERRFVLFGIVLGVSLPFLFAPVLPSTDLPQHIAQIRMARDALAGHAPELVINWMAPNNLVYLLLGVLSTVMPAVWAARVGLWTIALGWALATFVLAIKRGRSPVAGLVASLLAFQAGLYWGFVNFLIGWPIFVAWLQLTGTAEAPRRFWRRGLVLGAVALLLYCAHILWFAVGCVWLVCAGLVTRPRRRAWFLHAASVLPGALLAAIWYPKLSSSRALFRTGAAWTTLPWQRLYPVPLSETVMGGDTGRWPAVTGGVLIIWVLVVLVTRRGELRRHSDRLLLWAAALLSVIVFLAPDRYMNTIYFAQRWAPCAVALLLIGLPPPRMPFLRWIASGLVAAGCIATSAAWRSFSTVEMTGFAAALAATPPNSRVLEADTVRVSEYVGGQPFMQMMGYLQAERDGTLNFSFAEHGSGLVSYRSPRELTWTPGLEWHPERTQNDDILQFDVVLVNGTPETHQRFMAATPVIPATTEGRWRLYTVRRGQSP